MTSMDWIRLELDALQGRALRRRLPSPIARMAPEVELDGRTLLNFASNDYLGLAGDPRLGRAAAQACLDEGVGRGSSPLICGRSKLHDQLEKRLARFEGCERALLFPSGYAANTGVIPALVERGDAVLSDAKNHASIVDGCRLSRAEVHVYPHADGDALETLLQGVAEKRRKLIVTDSVFSMDGDLAPLARLADLAERYGAILMVDEAHATGVFGRQGSGLVEGCEHASSSANLRGRVHVHVGTLSKALGAGGGFVCGSEALIEWLANRARSYFYSTAPPSAAGAAALAALDIVQSEPQRRRGLLQTAERLRTELRRQGWDVGASQSQIIPIIVGAPERALQLSAQLRERGMWVPAIRPPSVPPGEALLRLSLTAAHTPEMIDRLVEALNPTEAG